MAAVARERGPEETADTPLGSDVAQLGSWVRPVREIAGTAARRGDQRDLGIRRPRHHARAPVRAYHHGGDRTMLMFVLVDVDDARRAAVGPDQRRRPAQLPKVGAGGDGGSLEGGVEVRTT